MRLIGLTTISFGLLLFSACKPAEVPATHAEATAALRVCWRADDEGDAGVQLAFRRSMRTKLEAAGYTVTEKRPCDVSVSWRWRTSGGRRSGVEHFDSATLIVRGKGDLLIDQFQRELSPDYANLDETDRVAIVLVNALNASPKVAEYARQRRRVPEPPHDAPDAGSSESDTKL